MTTRDQARRAIGRRSLADDRRASAEADEGRPRLPDRLRMARESKGVDLFRAERDTKIRQRYLAALESGDYESLPGIVYTKGFLRNYAQYLGLNPDDILEQWRKERGPAAKPQPVAVVTRPVTMPRQGITLSTSMLAVALLLIVSIAVAGFLGSRLLPYLTPPSVAISHPATAVETVDGNATSYVFSGTANPGATIIITADGQDLDPLVADATGHWTYEYKHLHLGTNLFEIKATNPDTQRASAVIEIRIIVPTPQQTPAVTPTITLTSPEDEATFQNGAIPVAGKTTGNKVTIDASYIGPPGTPTPTASPAPSAKPSGSAKPSSPPSSASPKPSASGAPGASPSPRPSGLPAPATVNVNPDGTFSTSYQLPPGKWNLAVTASSDQGLEQTVHRIVTVQYKGVQVTIRIKGGNAWIKLWKDGVVDDSRTRVYHDGETISISGDKSVWIRTGVESVTYVTINGVDYGPLGKTTNPSSWRLEAGGPPKAAPDVF